MPNVEEVFTRQSVPVLTFVEPKEFSHLVVNLRTPGRGVVVEGPSGIGKTSAIQSAIEKLNLGGKVTKLSARVQEDVEYIEILPEMQNPGFVIVDDIHKLPNSSKARLADFMKILADRGDKETKIILIGINSAGKNLVDFAPDLVNRIDILRMENNPDEKVLQLLEKGEKALNISINIKEDIIKNAQGSFYIAQMMAYELCIKADILETQDTHKALSVSLESVKADVYERLSSVFRTRCEEFCRGTKFRPSGRAPYLHMLHWLATQNEWALDLRSAMRQHPEMRGSVGQVIDKGFLSALIDGDEEISSVIHFDKNNSMISVEDPQFVFYIRNIPWRAFSREIGFSNVDFQYKYDFALSFSGEDRVIAEKIFLRLQENEFEVFYDFNEQHRILAEDVEGYLRPIYDSDSRFVICILGKDYPRRAWTKFESSIFRDRFDQNAVIPVMLSSNPPGVFDEVSNRGNFSIDPSQELDPQIDRFVQLLIQKIEES